MGVGRVLRTGAKAVAKAPVTAPRAVGRKVETSQIKTAAKIHTKVLSVSEARARRAPTGTSHKMQRAKAGVKKVGSGVKDSAKEDLQVGHLNSDLSEGMNDYANVGVATSKIAGKIGRAYLATKGIHV